MKPLTTPPILRRYQIEIAAADHTRFVTTGADNLLTSLQTEPGTLAMFATHADAAGTMNEVFELYKDEACYTQHAQSPQFKRYGQLAKQVVKNFQLTELVPQVVISVPQGFAVSGSNSYQLQVVSFTTKSQPATIRQYWAQLQDERLMQFAATLPTDATQWYLLAAYPDQQAVKRGTQTLYYLTHLKQFGRLLDLASADVMITQVKAVGDYVKSSGAKAGQQVTFFTGFSSIAGAFYPQKFAFNCLLAVALVMVYAVGFYNDFKHQEIEGVLRFFQVLGLLSMFIFVPIISIIGDGDADLAKHIFMVPVSIDLIVLMLIADILNHRLWHAYRSGEVAP